MSIIIEKPCEKCGCEIHPLKTDYPPQRRQCKDCRNETNAKRSIEYYAKRRKLSMKLGLTDTVDHCLICERPLTGLRSRSKYCSNECSQTSIRLKIKMRSLAMMDQQKNAINEQQKNIRKEMRKMKREML